MAHDEEPLNLEEMGHLHTIDEQIDQHLRPGALRQPGKDKALEQPFLQELHDFYQPQAEAIHQTLDRVWGHLEQRGAVPAQHDQSWSEPINQPDLQQERQDSMQHIFPTGQRWSARVASLVAAAILVVLVGGLAFGLVLVRHNGNNGNSQTGASQNQTTTTPTSTAAASSFTVTSVDLAVTPASIAGMTCGSSVSFTYTATFHIATGSAGGTIQFGYTLNNGRSSTNASVNVSSGQTTATYTFTSSGSLPLDHTYPGVAEVQVTSPNAVNSPQVIPTGSCAAGSFKVTSASMAVSPTSIAGHACGTQITVTYTATFHIAPNGSGGTLRFEYTINNGRGTTPVSLSVAPGQTSITYSFTWKGALPTDHSYPEAGGVIVDYPNQINSPLVAPTGSCS
jgi:hypothetical protein